jgi:hypothetical protein
VAPGRSTASRNGQPADPARPFDYRVSLTHLQEDGYRDFTAARLSRGFVKVGGRAGLEAHLKINNMLDNRNETFGTFAPNSHEPGAPVERFLTPAPPISMLAGVRYAF